MISIMGCLYPTEEWEELESSYDHVLNVFSIINLDSGQPSYVGLYRTTDLDETVLNLVGADTLYWCDCDDDECWQCVENQDGYWVIDSIYEPAALIKDASVNIMDNQGNNYTFSYVDKITFVDTIYFDTTITIYGTTINWDTTFYDTIDFTINLYVDTTGSFIPQPETDYNLSITAPGYDSITGSLKTPEIPKIDSLSQRGSSVDTVIINEPFDFHWSQTSGMGLVTGEVIHSRFLEDSLSGDWCGGYFDEFVVDLSDVSQSPYGIPAEYCGDDIENQHSSDYFIRLTAMDDNYYNYFIVGEIGEYSNALLNYPTTKGRSVGIEGGFGFFGSIASDGLMLKIKP